MVPHNTVQSPSSPAQSSFLRSISAAGALAIVFAGCSSGPTPGGASTRSAEDAVRAPATTRVLVMLSSANTLELQEGRTYATGYYLNELMVPVKAMLDAGMEPVFANPRGNPAVVDPRSEKASYFGGDERVFDQIRALRDGLEGLKRPRKLADVIGGGLDGYAGVFVPGGHAPMGDLIADPDVGRVLRHFHEKKRPTGLICHGPVSLIAALPEAPRFVSALASRDYARASELARGWTYAGYQMTSFSTAEEQTVEEGGAGAFLGGRVRFYPDEALRVAGARVSVGEPWKSHVVVDRELFTAQQPSSDEEFSRRFVPALVEAARADAASPRAETERP